MYAIMTLLCLFVWTLPAAAIQLTPKEELGKLLYFDPQLSLEKNQSCSTCHLPPGFADPENVANPRQSVVSKGSVPGKLGTRNTPSAAYAAFSPYFHWNGEEGMYIGGQFWDGREPTLQAQAKGPLLDPVEMAMISPRSVKEAVRHPDNPLLPNYRRDMWQWPKPEVPQNVNREEMGNLKLTKGEVSAIVAFMQTLSDGYGKPLPNITLPPFP